MNRNDRAARSRRRRFGLLCLLGYVALSWAVRFDMPEGEQIASLLYPLDTFSMYAEVPGQEISYLLIRDAQGMVHRVTEFRSFDCVEPVAGSTARCSDRRGFQYHDRELIQHIERHAGPGNSDAELIFRTWHVRSGAGAVHVADCVVSRCKVSR
jgi:hypothetical protein